MKLFHLISLVLIPVAFVLVIVSMAGPSVPWSSLVESTLGVDLTPKWHAWNPYVPNETLGFYLPSTACDNVNRDTSQLGTGAAWLVRSSEPYPVEATTFALQFQAATRLQRSSGFRFRDATSSRLLEVLFVTQLEGSPSLTRLTYTDGSAPTPATVAFPDLQLTDLFRTYMLDWSASRFSFYVDGSLYFNASLGEVPAPQPAVPTQPMYFEFWQSCVNVTRRCNSDAATIKSFLVNGSVIPFCEFSNLPVSMDAAPLRGKICTGGSGPYEGTSSSDCNSGGKGITALMSIGIIVSFVSLWAIFRRAQRGTLRVACVALPGITSFLYFLSFVYWAGGCWNSLKTIADFDLDVGWILALISFLVALLVTILQFLVMEDGGAAKSGFTPSTSNKRLHLVSLMGACVAIVLAITSICSTTIPWSKFEGYLLNQYGVPQPAIISTGLLAVNLCYGSTGTWSGAAPRDCVDGGKVITGLLGVGCIVLALLFGVVLVRARTHHKSVKYLAMLLALAAVVLLMVPFIMWSGGCHKGLQAFGGNLSLDVGFALVVVSWVFVLAVLALQVLVKSQGLMVTHDGAEESTSHRPSAQFAPYAALTESELPFL